MQKTLFLCSRMEPFGVADLRSDLMSQFGYQSSAAQRIFRLHSEDRALRPNEDARMFCARAIQASDGVVLILDGSASSVRSVSDAPVLELEVMLAAACSKPVLVLDGSGGDDPLHQLLGTEFFSSPTGTRTNVLSLRGINSAGKIAHLKEVLAQTCEGHGPGALTLSAHVGWEKLFLARPDRLDAFEEDGGNFPFAQRGLNLPEMMSSDIANILDRADETFKADKMAALVLSWDAIRALSVWPWGTTRLDRTMTLLWLRSLSIWGSAMAWLGLFGHSSGAAMMTNLACRQIASRINVPETEDGGPFAVHRYLGGLASTYFSLSKLVLSENVQKAVRTKGIDYATEALRRANDPKAQAGLLAVRGPLFLATRSPTNVYRGFQDLRMSVRLHEKAGAGNRMDHGVATSRIQLGAAHKELAK